MSDAFLGYYNTELASIRAAAAAFAADHPRIAGRLRISEDAVEDPFVERLIESFAFLTARVRQKIDDDFPELTDALLGILYPHFHSPIPSMAIVQMEPRADLTESDLVPAGTLLDTEPVDGERCRFRTAYPVAIHPLTVRDAVLSQRPFEAPSGIPGAAEASACLRLTLAATVPDLAIGEAVPETLRFFLRGQPGLSYGLYEALLNDTVAVAFAADAQGAQAVAAGPDCIAAVGFGADEGILPYPGTSHIGYRLLTEYFTIPEKFLFVDVRLPAPDRLPAGQRLEIFVYLRRSGASLERAVSAEAFALNCTPIVNLFPQLGEPVALNQTTTDYRVVPDSRRVGALEVYAIERATIMAADGSRRAATPFYSIRHADLDDPGPRGGTHAWYTTRREPARSDNPGSETYLSLVDLARTPSVPADEVLGLDLTCLNRDLPGQLPFGGGHPYLTPTEPRPAVARVRALTAPTPTLRPAFRSGRWQLISQLALNHLSLAGAEGLAALREILLLYDMRESAETRALIDGVVGLSTRPGTARVRGRGGTAICRGLDVAIDLDPGKFSGNGAFLMASVLERFLGLYVSVNSFTRLTATLSGRTGILRTWPARSGDHVLL